MLKHPDLTRRRIEQFLKVVLAPQLFADSIPLTACVVHSGAVSSDYHAASLPPPPSRSEAVSVEPGYQWGPVWSDAWFYFHAVIPAEWQDATIAAILDVGTEAILWKGSNPLQGIDSEHAEYILPGRAKANQNIELVLQATGMNPFVRVHGRVPEPAPEPFTFHKACLARLNKNLIKVYYDLKTAFELMQELPANSERYGQLLAGMNHVINLYESSSPDHLASLSAQLAPLMLQKADASAHRLSAVGHAHIDTAWLWPLERTRYKCIHTFATATRLMEEYGAYHFTCTQAAQYEWIKRLSPKLYERIKKYVRKGQWEVNGSMWVEADCNLISGESLVRQILHGKNYFLNEFGVETRILWLPDVFGYSAALPQILKKARVDYFLTQKISWNQTNKFPHHTFLWQGIDGTRIFTHFPPADTYNGNMSPKELVYNVHNFREHDRATRSLYLFGYGDGGGGPTREMLERAERSKNLEGLPRVEQETALDFFHKAEQDATDLPVWVGELYLELHRGTYTTQAANKKANRKNEIALRNTEFLALVSGNGTSNYPVQQLDRAWKTLLLHQFHDIIPGSSIHEVYEESSKDYNWLQNTTQSLIDQSLAELAAQVNTQGMKRPVMVVSNLTQYCHELVITPLGQKENPVAAVGPEGDAVPVQIITGEQGDKYALFTARNLPLHGYAVWDLAATSIPPSEPSEVSASPLHLENASLRVEFHPQTGLITRIFDQDSEREVLPDPYDRDAHGEPHTFHPEKAANQLQLFQDTPLFWDAWDIDPFYNESTLVITQLDSVEVLENGPVRASVRFQRTLPGGKSVIRQTISLAADSGRLDFYTEVDWHENAKLLKAAFPVQLNASRASYEIQYGYVERPTHYNTSWDMARFEVCAQRWADLSEGDYGVALINDCKYGYDIHGSTMRLTLLRSPSAPDPQADRGLHTFTYSLLPHGGDLREGEVVEHAAALNNPPVSHPIIPNQPGKLPLERSFFSVDNASVFIEAVKRAEKEEAVIVRMYEAHNTRGQITFSTTLPVKRAFLCDLMEDNLNELAVTAGEISLHIQPFEILTIKLLL